MVGIGLATTELPVLYIYPEYQRQDIGTALLDACLGNAPAYVWLIKNNVRGRPFYRSHGFKLDGTERLRRRRARLCRNAKGAGARSE
ncbi:GNAT family N-acetyltransferase [Trueperella pyogenes]|uniref:GNAT family N-acetyltransferase n=1 Tax=Trueperella pyogenes TaxID=1661 RepID=UPI00345E0091